jgi:hypothetical protein
MRVKQEVGWRENRASAMTTKGLRERMAVESTTRESGNRRLEVLVQVTCIPPKPSVLSHGLR